VKEIEVDGLSDAWFHRPDRPRGGGGQHRDAGIGKMLLQPAHRGKRGNAITDVIELDDEDPANLVPVDRRPTADHNLRRLVIDDQIVEVLG
jgi:hypothetical protein